MGRPVAHAADDARLSRVGRVGSPVGAPTLCGSLGGDRRRRLRPDPRRAARLGFGLDGDGMASPATAHPGRVAATLAAGSGRTCPDAYDGPTHDRRAGPAPAPD